MENKTNLNFVIEKLNTFKNQNIFEIGEKIGLNPLFYGPNIGTTEIVKHMNQYLNIAHIFDSFSNDNISIKTIRLKENNIPKESMSFNSVNFNTIIHETWETSFLRKKFNDTTFIFIVFQYIGETLYFRGALNWKCPSEYIEGDIKRFWYLLKETIENGVIITPKQQKNSVVYSNNLPGASDNPIMHIRPKANNGNDTVLLPDGQSITKQAYWFNSKFVAETLKDLPHLIIDEHQLQRNALRVSASQVTELSSILQDEIYTIHDFYEIAKETIPNFTITMVTPELIKKLHFKISVPYIFTDKYKSAEQYFELNLFKQPYITIDDESIYQESAFQKILEKSEKKLDLIKIEPNTYITKVGLENANITKGEIESFSLALSQFENTPTYFTYEQLLSLNFEHPLQELGFENIFYESILKYSKLFSHCILHGATIFKLGNRKFNLELFYLEILKKYGVEHFSLSKLQELLEDTFKIRLMYDQLLYDLKRFKLKPFYSPDLERIFINENRYYDYLNQH